MLSAKEKGFLRLIQRSPDIGDGWRQVSDALWALVAFFGKQELIETDCENKRVRLSHDGAIVVRYL
jgi:hypothetical protein